MRSANVSGLKRHLIEQVFNCFLDLSSFDSQMMNIYEYERSIHTTYVPILTLKEIFLGRQYLLVSTSFLIRKI